MRRNCLWFCRLLRKFWRALVTAFRTAGSHNSQDQNRYQEMTWDVAVQRFHVREVETRGPGTEYLYRGSVVFLVSIVNFVTVPKNKSHHFPSSFSYS
jgi:hypothetical protein